MKFYIVTPAYNSLLLLQRCMRSVADQVMHGVEVHHHVQDGGSTDGTIEWLQQWKLSCSDISGYTFTYESRKDKSMYDAINMAWSKLPLDANVTAHLNCDEQYLPCALKEVAAIFLKDTKAEVVSTAFIIIDAEDRYICHRRPVQATRLCSQVACELNTCSCFHKVETFVRHGIRFDLRYRVIGDMIMYRELMNYGVKVRAYSNLITSSFAITGKNLAWTADLSSETEAADAAVLPILLRFRKQLICWSNLRRRVNDLFCKDPREYSIYSASDLCRTTKRIKYPTSHWGMRSVAVNED